MENVFLLLIYTIGFCGLFSVAIIIESIVAMMRGRHWMDRYTRR